MKTTTQPAYTKDLTGPFQDGEISGTEITGQR